MLNVNHVILGNMSALEDEAYGKILTCFQSVQGEQQQSLEENRKLRKDICAIIKLVQNAYHRNCWQTEGINLETLTIRQLLGVGKDQCLPESESEKVGDMEMVEKGCGDSPQFVATSKKSRKIEINAKTFKFPR